MKRIAVILAVVFSLVVVSAALAANPPGTGQPSQSCQAQPSGPAGLTSTTNGFARVVEGVYAGSAGRPSLAHGNAAAALHYDVACFQVSQPH